MLSLTGGAPPAAVLAEPSVTSSWMAGATSAGVALAGTAVPSSSYRTGIGRGTVVPTLELDSVSMLVLSSTANPTNQQ